jgi:hypothetical protein
MEVDYPGFGSIVVEGTKYDHDVVVESGRVRRRDKKPSRAFKSAGGHTPLSLAEEIPWSRPALVIGTGHSGRLPVLPEVRDEAERRGIELVVLPTSDACALLSALDPSGVNAVLHVTC